MADKQPDYFVRGGDGQDYAADRATIWRWIRDGQIAPSQMIYDSMRGVWARASEHADLRDAFGSRHRSSPLQRVSPEGDVQPDYTGRVILTIILFILLIVIAGSQFIAGFIGAASFILVGWFAAMKDKTPLSFVVGERLSSLSQATLLIVMGVLLGLLGTINAVYRLTDWRAATKARTVEASRVAKAADEATQREEALRKAAPTFAGELAQVLDRAELLEKRGDLRAAGAEIERMKARTDAYSTVSPMPDELRQPLQALGDLKSRIENRLAEQQQIEGVRSDYARAKELVAKKEWISADDTLAGAIGRAQKLSNLCSRR